jgi:hypothetical protein
MFVTGISDHAVSVHSLQVAVTSRVARASHRENIAAAETGPGNKQRYLLCDRAMKTMGIF